MTDYPWPDDLVPYAQSFYLQPHTGGTESPFSRVTKTYGLSAPRWVTSLQFRAPASADKWSGSVAEWGERLDAMIAKIEGGLNRVILHDFRREGETPTSFTNAAITAGDTAVTLVGASAGDIRMGEYIGGDGRPHIITRLSVSGGNLVAAVKPAFSADIAAGEATFEKVPGRFMLLGDDTGGNLSAVGELTEYRLDFVEDPGDITVPTEFTISPLVAVISPHVLANDEIGAPDASDPDVAFAHNLYGFCYGPRQQGNGGTTTLGFANGPTQTSTATRWQMTATNQVFSIWTSTYRPDAGTYGIKTKVKLNSGTSPANMRYGNGTDGYTTISVNSSTWTELPRDITTNGTNWASYVLTGDGTNMLDLLIDEQQIYQDVLAANLPTLSAEAPGGDFIFPLAFPHERFTGKAVNVNGAKVEGGIARLPSYPAVTAFTEITVIVVAALDDDSATNKWLFSTDFNASLGTTSTTFSISSSQADGQMDFSGTSLFAAFDMEDQGFHSVALRQKNGAVEGFIDGIEMASDTDAFAGFSAKSFRVGAAAALSTAYQTSSFWRGRWEAFAIFDRYLTDDEIRTADGQMRAALAASGLVVNKPPAFLLAMGDSQTWHINNAANQGPSHAYLQAVAGTFTPNLQMRNLALSGNTLDDQLAFMPKAEQIIRGAVAVGATPIATMYIGSNPGGADVNAGGVAYWNRVKTEWADEIISWGGIPIIGTLVPRGDLNWETERLAFNAALRASGYRYADYAADPVMGDAANYTLVGTTWVKSDGLHWTTTGQTLIGAIDTIAIQAAIDEGTPRL